MGDALPIILIAALPVLGIIFLAWRFSKKMDAVAAKRRIREEKLTSVAAGHREMAESHESSVEELEPQAIGHREAAADHTRIADELEERIEREQRHAQFHAERATETEQERERT